MQRILLISKRTFFPPFAFWAAAAERMGEFPKAHKTEKV